MRIKSKITLCLAACVAALSSCLDIKSHLEEDPYNPNRPGGPATAPRTFFIYMGGDNSLNGSLQGNIAQLMAGTTREVLRGGRVLVYYTPLMTYNTPSSTDLPFTTPQLLEIFPNPVTNKGIYRVLKSYDKQSSASPQVLKQVLDDVFSYAPSESYCIDFSSHGTGWLPAARTTGTTAPAAPAAHVAASPVAADTPADSSAGTGAAPVTMYSFTNEGRPGYSFEMNIDELAAALPDNKFDFIMFDACLMGGVEVAYQLRDKSPYVVASVAEILSKGFPYDKFLAHIFTGGQPDLQGMCDEYIKDYQSDPAVISIYNTANLPALAAATRGVVDKYGAQLLSLPVTVSSYPGNPVQYYYSYGMPPTALDMGDAMNALLQNRDPALLASWQQALSGVVVYARATDYAISKKYLFGSSSDPFLYTRYSGITMHIPSVAYNTITASSTWNPFFYNHTQWGKDVFPQP